MTTEEFLIQTDAFTDDLINKCNNADTTFDLPFVNQCETLLVSSWYTYCKDPGYHDKLDFCKNGKLEGYLKKDNKI
ncbi:MAG: hypothetical protein ACTHKK_03360 [Candidatus Nitrosocosmicus sp.]